MKMVVLRAKARKLIHKLLTQDLVKIFLILHSMLQLFDLFHILLRFLLVPLFDRFQLNV